MRGALRMQIKIASNSRRERGISMAEIGRELGAYASAITKAAPKNEGQASGV